MIIFRNKNNCYWLVNYRTYLITHIFTYDLCAFKISEWFHLWLWPLVFGSWLGANTVVQHSCLVSRSQLRIVMGPLSDMVGRRAGLILCSIITLVGALLSTFAWGENALIAARREQKWKTKTTWDVLWDFAPFHNRCCTSKFWPTSTPRALLKIVKCWVLEHCGHTRGWRCSCISIGFCSVPTKNIARIITGVGMGGEYPLASSHSAESSEDSGDGARNVALLYLFGSGGGQALCPLVTYLMDVSGVPQHLLWRWIFAVGSILPAGQQIAALLWLKLATILVGNCDKLWMLCG